MKLLPILPMCRCGCDAPVSRLGNRFVVGHNFRGGHHTDEAKEKISVASGGNKHGFGYKHTDEWKRNNSLRMEGNQHALGHKQTEEHRANIGKGVRKAVKENGGGFNVGWHHTEEWKENNSRLHKGNQYSLGRKHTNEFKQAVSARHKGRVNSEETKRKMSLAAKGRDMSLPVKASADLRRGTTHTVETKTKMSAAQKRLWADPIHHKEQQSKMARGARLTRPNIPETKLLNLLESIQPSDWKYVGNGNLIIAGKNPDFANVNGKKLLVELFGSHWHRDDSPRKRMAIFRPFGFRTLIVWEHELQDQKALVNKINRFVNC